MNTKLRFSLILLTLIFAHILTLDFTQAELVGTWALTKDSVTEGNTLKMTPGTGYTGAWTALGDGNAFGRISQGGTTFLTTGGTSNANAMKYTYVAAFGASVFDTRDGDAFTSGSTTDSVNNTCVNLGRIPTLTVPASTVSASYTGSTVTDLTLTGWLYVDSTSGSQSILLGDRYGTKPSYQSASYNFWKYQSNGNLGGIVANGAAPLSRDGWHFVTISKKDAAYTSYVDGNLVNTATYGGSDALYDMLFTVGGDASQAKGFHAGTTYANGEEFSDGMFYNLSIYSHAMTDLEAFSAYRQAVAVNNQGLQKAGGSTGASVLKSDAFTALDPQKWLAAKTGFGNADNGKQTYTTAITDGEQLQLTAFSQEKYWYGGNNVVDAADGVSTVYHASAENEITVSADLISLTTDGDTARAALTFFNAASDDWKSGQYVMLSHLANRGSSTGMTGLNSNSYAGCDPVIDGKASTFFQKNTNAVMSLKHDGKYIYLYADGRLLERVSAAFTDFKAALSVFNRGQNSGTAGTSTAVFDNYLVTQRSGIPVSTVALCDDFESVLSSSWKTSGNTAPAAKFGVLQLTGNARAAYAPVLGYDARYGFHMAFDRDSMFNEVGTTSGIQLSSETGAALLSIWQTASNAGAVWGITWGDGITLTMNPETGVNPAYELDAENRSVLLLASDTGEHQVQLDSIFDAVSETSRMTLSLDGVKYDFSVKNLETFLPTFYTLGANAYAGFDNFRFEATELPEPSAWLLFLLAGCGIFMKRFRKH